MQQFRSCLGLVLLAIGGHGSAEADYELVRFTSGENRVALVELYTSEGCSSCPPADRWLSNLKSDPGLWRRYAPIAFHVDYWDYIGWRDRFAQGDFSKRQRRYAEERSARAVYTPGFFMNGREWRGWFRDKRLDLDKVTVGELSVQLDGEVVVAHFSAERRNYGDLLIHVAVLGMNLETQVNAGENNGRTLKHDFVALNVVSAAFDNVAGRYEAIVQIPETRKAPQAEALVAWVSESGRQAPIQAVGGFIRN